MKKGIIITIISFLVLIGTIFISTLLGNLFGETAQVDLSTYTQSDDNVSITDLHVDVSFDKNNVANVTETFNVKFNENGLTEVIRFVPYASYVYRELDGGVQSKLHYSKIYDIVGEGSNFCNVYKDEQTGYLTIGLKDYNYLKNQVRSFTVSYKMDMGKDTNKGFDDIYFNIVGTNSLLTIENITFTASLPGEIEETKSLKVYYGKAGSTSVLDFAASGELVTGEIDKLGPGEGITIRAVYEDGYLTYNAEIYLSQILCIVVAIVSVIIAVIIFLLFTQRKNYPKPVEVVAPEGATPLKADAFVNGECGQKSISAGIIYLASKGFLKIKQHENEIIELIRIRRDIDSLDTEMKMLFNLLFPGEIETFTIAEQFSVEFYKEIKSLRSSQTEKTKAQLYDKKKKVLKCAFTILNFIAIAVSFVLLFVISKDYLGFMSEIFANQIFTALLIFAFTVFIVVTKNHWSFKIVCGALYIIFGLTLYLKLGYAQIDEYWLGFIALVLIAAIPMLVKGESIYTAEGEKIKGRYEGFKNFIEKCEVSQLKMFTEENPTYYFDVLPYAYVFGLSDVWMEKFKSLEITLPEWVETDTGMLMDYMMFNSMFNDFTNKSYHSLESARIKMIQETMSSIGGSSGGFGGGGSFGGGGFSGGGAGGGGFGAR